MSVETPASRSEEEETRDDFGVILMEGSCSRNEQVTKINNIFALLGGTEFVSVCETNQFFKKVVLN